MQMGQLGRSRIGFQRVGQGLGADLEMPRFVGGLCGQFLIEQREEFLASVMVMLPGVFTVEDNRDKKVFARRLMRDCAEPANDVFQRELRALAPDKRPGRAAGNDSADGPK